MRLIEAIDRIDTLMPNIYTQQEKIVWLSEIEYMIKSHIIDTHEGGEGIVFNGYNDETPLTTEMIVHQPYDDLYILWLEQKIHYMNGEYTKYNNSVTRFNDFYSEFENEYNRTHLPKSRKFKYF